MDFANCCRLCLRSGEADGFFRIAEHRTLQLMIVHCFEIVITDDEVVNKICSFCKDEVDYVNTIRKKVQAADYEVRNFYERLKDKDTIEDLEKPPEDSTVVSFKVEPELELEFDDEKITGQIEDDTGGQNSKHEMDHEEQQFLEETSFVVQFEDINNDCTRKSNQIDVETGTTKKSPKRIRKTQPVRRKYKRKGPRVNYSDYRCFICSTDLANQDELNNHLPTHIDPGNPQKCSICNLVVATVRNLNMHLRRIHFRKWIGRIIPCEECRKNGIVREYSSSTALGIHIRTVHEGIVKVSDKKFVCSHCGKKFNRSTHLKTHENLHTKAKSYQCKLCSSSFSSQGSLSRHESTHTAEKPFVCDQCGTAFRRSFNLQMHKANRHSDDRPFGCEICGARFKVKMALSAHLKTHGTNS